MVELHGRRRIAPLLFLCIFNFGLFSVSVPSPAITADLDATLLATSGFRYAHPRDLILSFDKSLLFVPDLGNDRIKILDPRTLKSLDIFGQDDLVNPHDVALDNRGRVLVADSGNNRIVLYRIFGTKAKKVGTLTDGISTPKGVAAGPGGAIYVTSADTHNVVKFVNGKIARKVGGRGTGPNQYFHPQDITLDLEGRIYVADQRNDRIQVLDADLNFIRALEGPPYGFKEPSSLKIDINGWLYVADKGHNQIKIFDENHKPRGVIGSGVAGRKPGQLRNPEGLEVWGNRIWVSDTYNSRILLYSLHGNDRQPIGH